jgi:hypothetical protein
MPTPTVTSLEKQVFDDNPRQHLALVNDEKIGASGVHPQKAFHIECKISKRS